MTFQCALRMAILAALILASPALAADGETYPTAERVITETEATSTCIGDPRTPVCAVETRLACTTRLDPELCARVSSEPLVNTQKILPLRYRIESACYYWTDLDATTGIRGDEKFLHASVAVRIYNFGGDLYYYAVKPTDSGWQIVFFAIEGEVGPIEMECTAEPPPRR